ncbi:5460_t:CDS:1, partial [Acaulospora colombiana]
MPPNPPEEFSPATVSAYIPELETTTSKHSIHSPSKRRNTNPHSFPQPSNNMSTTTTSLMGTSLTDGPRIDTDFVIRGYQQKQAPPRKRSFSKPPQDPQSLTLTSTTPVINSNLYNNNNFEKSKTSRFDVSNLHSIDFGRSYKSNSLLGKLRQQYEAVEKEKVTSNLASRTQPSEKSHSPPIN